MMNVVFRPKNNTAFWTLQLSGWGLLTLFEFFFYVYPQQSDLKSIAGFFVTYVVGFAISVLLRYHFRHIRYQSRTMLSLSVIVVSTAILASVLWRWLDVALSIPIHGVVWVKELVNDPRFFRSMVSNIFYHFLVLFCWSALYFLIKFWQEWSDQKERTEKANALAQAAQLQMLRYQLNPHFLFNSLNSIRALIDEDKKTAKAMITELSEFLRYSLISKHYSDVPLDNEIEAIRHYFAIEKKRYEDKLDVSVDIDPLAEDYPVLSFLMHPLVENAVKYGMQTSRMPLKIRIEARVQDGTLTVRVSNTGKWVESGQEDRMLVGTGTGLDNVRQRLENAFPNRHRMDITEEDGWVYISIQMTKDMEDGR